VSFTLTRRVALGAGAILALGAAAPPLPRRIVSLNPCLDAILVQVADRGQIAAISHYSHDLSSSSIGPLGQTFPFTYGSAEEILALDPDLVLTNLYSPASTRAALARLGIRVELFGGTDSVAESLSQVAQLAHLVGHPERGQALIARIDRALAEAAPAPGTPRLSALTYQAGGVATARGALMDEMMARAGLDNAATRYGLKRTGSVPLERLIADPPDVLLAGQSKPGAPTWADRVLRHPALAHAAPRMHRATFPQRLTFCGGPVLIETARMLARVRTEALAARG
jgi:iron complex transport system substrate-binding protein